MNESLNLRQSLAGSSMLRGRQLPDRLNLHGFYKAQLVDRFGNPLTDELIVPNGICTAAKDALFNMFFNAATGWTSWYIGLINNTGFTAIQPTDVMASHSGWTEFTAYTWGSSDVGNRQPWGQGSSSGGSLTNGTQLVYTFTDVGGVAGIFVTSKQARNDWSGSNLLWSTALFNAALTVADGDQLKISYTLAA